MGELLLHGSDLSLQVVLLLVGTDTAVAEGFDFWWLVEVGIDIVTSLSGGGLE